MQTYFQRSTLLSSLTLHQNMEHEIYDAGTVHGLELV